MVGCLLRRVALKKQLLLSRRHLTQGGSCGSSTLPRSHRTFRRRHGMPGDASVRQAPRRRSEGVTYRLDMCADAAANQVGGIPASWTWTPVFRLKAGHPIEPSWFCCSKDLPSGRARHLAVISVQTTFTFLVSIRGPLPPRVCAFDKRYPSRPAACQPWSISGSGEARSCARSIVARKVRLLSSPFSSAIMKVFYF